ncbi:putative E3 ubiquitin-protein ligase UNKL isoform X3 [Haliotis rufescens]|uniref:putative E3 ubiquitin-protein ligase UNKL isoform X3 n=1 Tax=Haliotis rufescens TaxID=6454 RepID=UPI00201F65E6|nr:putative E3 ubiquitin-protein ligase UNKL isoform X3 [Haliotis rufescens]
MPSEAPLLPTQTEKPPHYMYLKEFRTQQCTLFLQHKCTQHRPFTCFHWHFLNQRRRRPVRRRDGTFNYSPDIYCTKYDETTGICPDGDDCPFLHRTAGDTERRYHLRYYKTGTCVYETDPRGHCTKNGPHCAFAHGTMDVRPPVYDIHELQSMDVLDKVSTSPSSLEKEKILAEDPKWNDTNYVLSNYKTEQCKRPPRLCRQGYACPQFHNSRDRRRSPKSVKYRSTPCPNVKHGDEWGDPALCESGDGCAYCHTRTEQQFHPEIYKSTKCNDMVQTGYCPRGPFCAFAHVENEMTTDRDMTPASDNSLAAFLSNVLPDTPPSNSNKNGDNNTAEENSFKIETIIHQEQNGKSSFQGKLPNPIGKERANSISSNHTKLRLQLQAIENDTSLDIGEKEKRKQNLILIHNLNTNTTIHGGNMGGSGVPHSAFANVMSHLQSRTLATGSTMSPLAPAFYPPGDTVESVIGKALDDISLDDFDINNLDKELDRDNDTNSVSSSLSAGLSASSLLGTTSGPIGIPPSTIQQRGSVGSLSQSPPSPFGSFPHSMMPLQVQKHDHSTEQGRQQSSSPFLNYSNTVKLSSASYSDVNSMSPRSTGPQSPMLSSSSLTCTQNSEIQRLREELIVTKAKLADWEGVYTQAKCACDAWKKEAEESMKKAKGADEDKIQAVKQRDESLTQVQRLKQELESLNGGPYLRTLHRITDLENLSLPALRHIRQTLHVDLERVDEIIYQQTSTKCLVCQTNKRNVSILPCSHRVLCEACATKTRNCPFCHVPIQTTSVNFL